MVSAGTYGATSFEEAPRRRAEVPSTTSRMLATKVMGMMALALAAVVCVTVLSDRMGETQGVEMVQQQLHNSDSDFSVADAILDSAGVHDKKGSISASMAALAAQAAQEKETGRLTPTVELPQIPKAIAKMAAEAKHEIMIEQNVDKRNKAHKMAAKAAAAAKVAAKKAKDAKATAMAEKDTAAATKANVAKVQEVADKQAKKAKKATPTEVKKAQVKAAAAKAAPAAAAKAAPAAAVAAIKAAKK